MTEGIHYALSLERSVLGLCMLESTAYGRTHGMIDDNTFYLRDHATIYKAMKDMNDEGLSVDRLEFVWHWIMSKGIDMGCTLNHSNPPGAVLALLAGCMNQVVNSAHLEYECTILKEMWRKRELTKLTMSGIDQMEDARKQGYLISEQVQNIIGGEVKKDWYSMDELIYNLMIHQDKIKTGQLELVTTGLKAIDRLNGGFSPGQLIVIGARPSVGKSALMGLIATSIAEKKKKVGIISLEMLNNEIAARLASIDTDTDFSVIYRNLFRDEEHHEAFYNQVSRTTVNLPIFVSDKTKVDVTEIRAKAAKLKYKHGLDILMVDYLQLVESTTNKNYNREQEVAKISRGLKLMAMEMQIPVIVLCQLNRAVTARKGYPQLSDLRESGAIEQDADIVMMLHRDWLAGVETNPNTGESTEFSADLLGVKWRNGAQFHLELDFDPQKMKFKEQAKPHFIPVKIETDENDPF